MLVDEDPKYYKDDLGHNPRKEWDEPLPVAKSTDPVPTVSDQHIKMALEIYHSQVKYLHSLGVDACKEYSQQRVDYILEAVVAGDLVCKVCQRPVVAVKIPEVDEMLQRAQDKVDAIKRVQLRTAGSRPIDEVVFAQNVPTYNPEWQHSNEGKATSYLATLVCRYMNELQRKDKKVVLSAKALEAIYHTASSSVGKLISGKQYLGGYAMEQQRGKAEAEGKELPYKRRKKLQTKDTALPSPSGSRN